MREREPVARRVDEAAREVLALGEGQGVDEDVEPAVGVRPASGLTRFSISDSIDEKPTSAPASWSARAIPHAIE